MKKWRCTVCGYIHTGETPPEACPVCGAAADKFELVSQEGGATETGAGKSESPFAKLVALLLKNHVHPIVVHTPNGIVPAAVIFLVLAVVLRMDILEPAAYYNMIVVLLAMPVVLFTGFIEWQKHYNGGRTSIFMTKITCGIVVLVTVGVLVVWRTVDPLVALPGSSSRWIFLLLHLVVLTAVGLAGHLGGKLVFSKKRK